MVREVLFGGGENCMICWSEVKVIWFFGEIGCMVLALVGRVWVKNIFVVLLLGRFILV